MIRGLSTVEAELLRLWEQNGELSPASVLAAATPPESPLHGYFTWDDSVAAHEHRLTQAGGLIRSVKIKLVKEEPDGTLTDYRVRRWVAASRAEIPGARPGSYVPAQSLDGAARTALLQKMQREVQALRNRYGGLVEFWQQIDAMAAEHSDDDGQRAS